jgi:soluble lytic murein transglycosylase-like protein
MRIRTAIPACSPKAHLPWQTRSLWRACFGLAALALCLQSANAQIAKIIDDSSGRHFFVNSDPAPSRFAPNVSKFATPKSRATIFLPAESSFAGRSRPAMTIDRDGAERLVREAAERHHMDPALVRAVIETESGWNATAKSRKGALGLMQLIPTTAVRFGVNDAFSPQQNVDAGVRYLKTLLQRYNGNLDLALAAYNAGEGAVDRAHGVPAFRETRDYVQKVQNAYFRPGSGRMEGLWTNPDAIRKEPDPSGRVIFTNE